MSKGKNDVRGRSFTSAKSANNFAKAVNGTVSKSTNSDSGKTTSKVSYTKGSANGANFTNPHWNK